MLRLMANEANTADPTASGSSNNALMTPTPPPMPPNYSGRLANTRQYGTSWAQGLKQVGEVLDRSILLGLHLD
jgi:hypothetical protein